MVWPMLIWGSIAGCDIVTRSGFSCKWKFVPYPNHFLPRTGQALGRFGLHDVKEIIGAAHGATTLDALVSSGDAGLLFQSLREEADGAFPCVGSVVGTVAVFIVGIFEAMAGVVVDLDVDPLA